MASQQHIDLIPLERQLANLAIALANKDDEGIWESVEDTAMQIANSLRTKAGPSASFVHSVFSAENKSHSRSPHNTRKDRAPTDAKGVARSSFAGNVSPSREADNFDQ